MKKLELVNRNAKTVYEAYGMTKEEFNTIIDSFLEKANEMKEASADEMHNFLKENKKEAIISFVVGSDPEVVELFVCILEEIENVKIENTVDLIEVLNSLKLEDALNYMVKTQLFGNFIK